MRPLFTLLLLVAVPAGATADEPKQPDFYPLAKGNKWEYRVDMNGKKFEATTEVVEFEHKDGKSTATVESRTGSLVTKATLSADAKGVSGTALHGVAAGIPVTLIKYPTKAETWTEKVKVAGTEVSLTWTLKEAVEVTVPAGKFKAIPVEQVGEVGGEKSTVVTWYADGVGIVKQTAKVGPLEVTIELTTFTLGK